MEGVEDEEKCKRKNILTLFFLFSSNSSYYLQEESLWCEKHCVLEPFVGNTGYTLHGSVYDWIYIYLMSMYNMYVVDLHT